MTSQAWAKIGYSKASQATGLSDVRWSLHATPVPIVRYTLAGFAVLCVGISPSPVFAPREGNVSQGHDVPAVPPPRAANPAPRSIDVTFGGAPVKRPAPADEAIPSPPPAFRPLVRLVLPDPPQPLAPTGHAAPVAPDIPVPPVLDIPPVPFVPAVQPPAPAGFAVHQRAVDIEQIAQVEGFAPRSVREELPFGQDGTGHSFAMKAEAIQIALPPVQLTDADASLLMAGGPVEMTVRLGAEAIGQVSFRMSEQHGIDVQLSGLLDLVSSRLAPDEFARLRGSAAADSFVSIDQLRDAGLNLRYDPVYDELRLSA